VVLPEEESIVKKLRGIIPNDSFTAKEVKRERLSDV
jgi:hypothetical protein